MTNRKMIRESARQNDGIHQMFSNWHDMVIVRSYHALNFANKDVRWDWIDAYFELIIGLECSLGADKGYSIAVARPQKRSKACCAVASVDRCCIQSNIDDCIICSEIKFDSNLTVINRNVHFWAVLAYVVLIMRPVMLALQSFWRKEVLKLRSLLIS